MFLWVVYDISDNSTRKAVSSACRDFGLTRLQRSVFFGYLDINGIEDLRKSLEIICNSKTTQDSVFILPVCDSCIKKKQTIGNGFDETEYLPGSFFIYSG